MAHRGCADTRGRGFTLLELLVVVAVVALLVGLLLPTLAKSREAARAAVCLSNLRSAAIACQQYADEFAGRSPAIGQPYAALPNWALVVQAQAGRQGDAADDLYRAGSVLVCPTIAGVYARQPMVRTYAINATGHAGLAGDPDNYDTQQTHIRMDAVGFPAAIPLLADSDVPPATTTNPPPPTRTASMIDFRQDAHVQTRLGWFHARGLQAAMFDLSARRLTTIDPKWIGPLP